MPLELKLKVRKIIEIKEKALLLIFNDVKDAEQIFNDNEYNTLVNCNITPVPSAEVSAARSIIIKKIDSDIINHDCNLISNEISKENNDLKTKVFKIGKNMLKIVLESINIADRVANNGIFMFHRFFSSSQLVKDKFIKLNQCKRCFKWDEHLTNKCPEPLSFKKCAKCSSTQHNAATCNSPTLQCPNCKGNHDAFSKACIFKQKLLKERRASHQKEETNPWYSGELNAAQLISRRQESVKDTPDQRKEPYQDLMAKYYFLICAAAASVEVGDCKAYSTELNRLLEMNDLPAIAQGVKFPIWYLQSTPRKINHCSTPEIPETNKSNNSTIFSTPTPVKTNTFKTKPTHSLNAQMTPKSPLTPKSSLTPKISPQECNSPLAHPIDTQTSKNKTPVPSVKSPEPSICRRLAPPAAPNTSQVSPMPRIYLSTSSTTNSSEIDMASKKSVRINKQPLKNSSVWSTLKVFKLKRCQNNQSG